ncbi:MAG: DUF3047 domain-containing protein [Gemmatimonadota bacterium]
MFIPLPLLIWGLAVGLPGSSPPPQVVHGLIVAPDTLDPAWVSTALGDSIAPWRKVHFGGGGTTEFERAHRGGCTCLLVRSESDATALVQRREVVLDSTPVLAWSWWVERTVEAGDMSRREAEDAAARVYVTFALPDSGVSFGQRLRYRLGRLRYGDDLPGSSIMYVWAHGEEVGIELDSPYSERVRTVVLRNANDVGGGWRGEVRDVSDDYRRLFGADPPEVTGVGIMSDSDNTGGRGEACYQPILFSSPLPPAPQEAWAAGSGAPWVQWLFLAPRP